MARINVFEGSRRIALLLKVAWLIGVVLYAFNDTPYITMHFATESPSDAFHRAENCVGTGDGTKYVTSEIGDGRKAYLTLCFKAQPFVKDVGKEASQLVPYRLDGDSMWGAGPYSQEVQQYMQSRADRFVLAGPDLGAALDQWRQERRRGIRNAVLGGIGGWIVLWLIQSLIGWIGRGFLGIPTGSDRREGTSAET